MSRPHSSESRTVIPYEVGYGKPPKVTQFKKGQSGNPRGRPKGKRTKLKPLKYELKDETFKTTFLEEAYRMVSINTGNGEQSIPIARAVMRALGVKAAKGHIHAQRLFAHTLLELEAQKRRESEELMDGIINYKQKWSEELERRASLGLPINPPVPHPDDIVCDMVRGTVEVRGPLTLEEKNRREYFGELLREWRETAANYEDTLSQPIEHEEDQWTREFVLEELAQCRKIIPMLEELSGQGEQETLTLYEAKKRADRLE